MLAVGATTGRVHSTRTTRAARGTSTSIRTIAMCTTAIATLGSLFGPFVLRVRTNLCSVTGKTGKGRKSCQAGAHAVACTEAPRPVTFSQTFKNEYYVTTERNIVNRTRTQLVGAVCGNPSVPRRHILPCLRMERVAVLALFPFGRICNPTVAEY